MATSWDNLPAVDPEKDDDGVSARKAPWADLPSADVELEKEKEEERSTIDQIGRTIGVGARALVEGAPIAIGSLPALASDAYDSLINLTRMGWNVVADEQNQLQLIPPFQATRLGMQAGEELASMTGLPKPETSGEKMLTEAIKFGEAAATGSGGAKLLQRFTAPNAAQLPSKVNIAATEAAKRPVSNIVGSAASGATIEGLIQADQPELALAAGLAAPFAVDKAFRAGQKVITPLPSSLTQAQKDLLQAAKTTGQTPTAAQAVGSKNLRTIETQLEQLPGGASSPAKEQQEQFNRIISQSFGENEPAITAKVLQKASEDIGGEINKIISPKEITFGSDFAQKVKQVSKDYTGYLPSDVKNAFKEIRNDLYKLIDPTKTVPGKEVQRIRTKILDLARNTNDRQYKKALLDMREVLDDHVERFIPDEVERIALRDARNKYRNLMRVEEALSGQTPSDIAGNISASKILKSTARENRSAAVRGQSYPELRTPAEISSGLAQGAGDSGTAIRNYYTRLAALLGGGGAAGGIIGTGPSSVAAGMGAAILGPYIANKAYWSSPMQRYLKNQALANRRSVAPGLMSPSSIVTLQQGGGLLSQ